MLIERVRIAGFKSFKHEVCFDLTSGLNVVVGPNGSGKSNAIAAIQFALTSELIKCSSNERKSLLYNGTDPRNENAFVEIQINNSDRRLPVDSDTVVFKRIFGSKKDRLLIDGKEMKEVYAFLESAGFLNPYFAIKQGKLSALTTATEHQRLHDLKEIAGINAYDSFLKKIDQSVKESEVTQNEIRTRISEIMDRIRALEDQRTELEKVASLDNEKRCLEYTLLQRDLSLFHLRLKGAKEDYDKLVLNYKKSHALKDKRIEELNENIADEEKAIADSDSSLNYLRSRKAVIETDIEQLQGQEARQQQQLRDCKDELKLAHSNLHDMTSTSEQLHQNIETMKPKLSALSESYEALLAVELEAKQKWIKEDARLKTLEKNMARTSLRDVATQRNSIIEDHSNIKAKVDQLYHAIRTMESSLSDRQSEIAVREEEKKKCGDEIQVLYDGLSTILKSVDADTKDLQELQDRRAALWTKENEIQQGLALLKDNKITLKDNLRKAVGQAQFAGWVGMSNIAAELEADENDGFYGTILDNVYCDEDLCTAVEAIGGRKLMHFIVRDTSLGRKLMSIFNSRKLPGEVSFISLDKIQVPSPSSAWLQFMEQQQEQGDSNQNASTNADVRKLIDSLRFIKPVKPAIEFVFGNTLLCRTLEIASSSAKKFKMNCVTCDGDKVLRAGVISGGYINSAYSKIRASTALTQCLEEINTVEEKLARGKTRLEELQNMIDVKTKALEKRETQKNNTRRNIEKEEGKKNSLHSRIRNMKNSLNEDTKRLNELQVELTEAEVTETLLNGQLDRRSNLSTGPNDDDLCKIQRLRHEVKRLARIAEACCKDRMEKEKEKTHLEMELDFTYQRQADHFNTNDAKINLQMLSTKRETIQSALEKVSESLQYKKTKLEDILKRIPDKEINLRSSIAKEKEYREERRKLMLEIIENHPTNSKFGQSIKDLEEKIKGMEKKLMNFGPVPSNVHSYAKKSQSQLYKQIKKVNMKLEKYNTMCRLPRDIHVDLGKIQEEINFKRDQLERGKRSIHEIGEFIATFKQKRLLHFFRILQRHFREMFKTLVPEGHVNLILCCRDYDIDYMEEHDELPDIDDDEMVGVRITASFSSSSGLGQPHRNVKDMKLLSGGQKSVIAVALILAIQKVDPIPIYLFDEIDSALDSDYREAVGRVIDEMSSTAQFICTTHRSEFVRLAKNHIAVAFHNTTSLASNIAPDAALNVMHDITSGSSVETTLLDKSVSTFEIPMNPAPPVPMDVDVTDNSDSFSGVIEDYSQSSHDKDQSVESDMSVDEDEE